MKNIELRIINEVTFPYLGDTDEDWVLSSFLSDSEGYSDLFDAKMKEASATDNLPIEFSTNSVGVDFYKDKVVLEDLYPEDENNPPKAEISHEDLNYLMQQWKVMLSQSTR